MPKPTSYVGNNDQDGSHDYNNDAYGYNYIYDYPIGGTPMYFPIRNTEDINLPKRIYVLDDSGERQPLSQPGVIVDEPDYIHYYMVFILLSVFLLLVFTRRA
jgi:hypothetical protein